MSRLAAALRLLGLGFFVGGSIALGTIIGLWLDNRLDTRPVLMIIGLLVGLAIAIYGVYQMVLPLMDNRRNGEG